jgi:hypothetical protein
VGAAVLVFQVAVWLPLHTRRADGEWMDFSVYRRVAQHVAAGEPLYGECATFKLGDPPSCFYYPPVLAVALAPLARLEAPTFQAVWYGGMLAAFWLLALGLVRLAGARPTLPLVLGAGAVLQLTPGMTTTMSLGNVELWVWALCALALGDLGRRPLLAVAACLKVYPAWAIGVSLFRRERRAWVTVGVAVGLAALAAVVVGVGAYRDWTAALGVLASGLRPGTNVSVSVAALRGAEALGLAGHGAAFLVVAPLVGVPAVAFATRSWSVERSAALVLVASVLLAPLCWLHYAPIVLIPAAAWLRGRDVSPPGEVPPLVDRPRAQVPVAAHDDAAVDRDR